MTSPNSSINNSPKPLSAPGGSVQVSSGTALAQVGHKLAVYCTVTGNLTVTTLDGTAATLSGLLAGAFIVLDVQHQLVSWTGTMSAISFWRIDG